jgi:hypothetical protein
MKDVYEVLRQKELEISKLEIEVEALRIAAPLLSDDGEIGADNQPTLARRNAPSQLTQVPQAVNSFPQPEHSAEWKGKEKAQGWP